MKTFLSIEQAANLLGVSVSTSVSEIHFFTDNLLILLKLTFFGFQEN